VEDARCSAEGNDASMSGGAIEYTRCGEGSAVPRNGASESEQACLRELVGAPLPCTEACGEAKLTVTTWRLRLDDTDSPPPLALLTPTLRPVAESTFEKPVVVLANSLSTFDISRQSQYGMLQRSCSFGYGREDARPRRILTKNPPENSLQATTEL
jgi:hypothetical protein